MIICGPSGSYWAGILSYDIMRSSSNQKCCLRKSFIVLLALIQDSKDLIVLHRKIYISCGASAYNDEEFQLAV